MEFHSAMELATQAFEIVGVAVLAVGGVIGFARCGVRLFGQDRAVAYSRLRADVGRTILLGLEILIVADIVKTITIETTVESAAALAIVVAVRTFLSFSLEIELDGVPPWRRAASRRPGSESEA